MRRILVAAVVALVIGGIAGCAAAGSPAGSAVPLSAAPRAAVSTSPSTAASASPAATTTTSSGPASSTAPVRPEVPSSPVLFLQADGTLTPQPATDGTLTLQSTDGETRDGEPYQPVVVTAANLWLTPTGETARFALAVDAGDRVGSAAQVRVSYDLTGDGTWERMDTYRYFATDPLAGAERYTQDAGLLSGVGTLGELTGGIVRLEIWSALGDGGVAVDLADSELVLPYS